MTMEIAPDIDQRTLVLTRIFKAPIHLVFDAWANPKHLIHWWGPKDFNLPHCEQDFRVGGKYRFCCVVPMVAIIGCAVSTRISNTQHA